MKADDITKRLDLARTEVEVAKRKKKELGISCEKIRKNLSDFGVEIGEEYDIEEINKAIDKLSVRIRKTEKRALELLKNVEDRINKAKSKESV